MSERGAVRAGLGVPSMLLILVVLCLAMLGVLSLISAGNDARLVARQAELTRGYYEAAARAQEGLAELDAQMAAAWRASAYEEQYAEACSRIEAVLGAPVKWEGTCASMEWDAGFDRTLVVSVRRCAYEEAGSARFVIVRHALEDRLEWEQTDGLWLMGL